MTTREIQNLERDIKDLKKELRHKEQQLAEAQEREWNLRYKDFLEGLKL